MKRWILWLLVLVSVLWVGKVDAGSPPAPTVKKWWTFSKDKGLVGDSTDENTKFATFLTVAGLTKEAILEDGKIYRVTDSVIIPESTKLYLNGSTIILDLDSAELGIMMPYSGSKIFGPGKIINLNKWAKPTGASGACIFVGNWPETNPVSPTDGVEVRDVTVRTLVKDAFGIVALGLVRNPVFDQINLDATSTDSCAGLFGAEWAYGYDSTYTYHPQNVTLSNFICDSIYNGPALTNPVYLSGVDGFKVSNGVIAYSGNNGFSVVAGEEGFAKADPAYHRVADTLYSSGGLVENVQLRSVARSGFVITGKPSATDVRYYPRLTYINCTVDTSSATTYHAGFLISYSSGVKLINCRVSKNIAGAKVEVGSHNITFDNCNFYKNRSSGIYIGDTTTVSTDMPSGISIENCLFENNGTSDHGSAIRVGKATEVNVGPGNTFGLQSGETQTYAVQDSASGTMRIFSNTVRGYYSGGAGFYLSDSCSVHDNEVYTGLTKYAGSASIGLDVGEGRIPFTIGAAGSVLGVLAGDTLGYFTPSGTGTVTDVILGDTMGSYFDTTAVVDTIQGLMGTYATSSEVGDSAKLRLPLTPAAGDSMKGAIDMSSHGLINVDTFTMNGSGWMDNQGGEFLLGTLKPMYIVPYDSSSGKDIYIKANLSASGANRQLAGWEFFSTDTIVLGTDTTISFPWKAANDSSYSTKGKYVLNSDQASTAGDVHLYFGSDVTRYFWWDYVNGGFSRFRIGGPLRLEGNLVIDNKTLFVGIPYFGDTTKADSALTVTVGQIGKFADDTLALIKAKDTVATWDNGGIGSANINTACKLKTPIYIGDTTVADSQVTLTKAALAMFADDTANAKTAYGWGDWSGSVGKLTDDSANWNTAYGWGDWSTTVGKLTDDSTNWNTAFGWGNWAGKIDTDLVGPIVRDTGGALYAPKIAPTFTAKMTADSIDADSLKVTQLDVTNARIATAFTIPRAKNPTTTSGQMAVDTNNAALEVYADGGGINSSVLIPMLVDKDFCVVDPNTVNDTIDLFLVSDLIYPFGVTLRRIELVENDSVGAYSIQFEEWTGKRTRSRAGYIDTVTVVADSSYVKTEVFTDAAMAAGNSIRAIIPSTTTDEISGKITFTVNPGD